ncbi:MAG: hypothetical protein ACUVX8_15785 [Candidatus Zipacnadales bacterium]
MDKIPRPSEIPLFFESQLKDDLPFVGNAEAILREGRHDGMITTGFVDGHAELKAPNEFRKLLEEDPFK